MASCIWNCIKRIPWWAWLILVAAGVIFAIIVYVTGGSAALGLPLWVQVVLAGLGPIGTTLGYCVNACKGR